MPMMSGRSGSTAARAAPISVPGSMRPVSSIVTWAWIGTSRPAARMARRAPFMAALRPSRSNWVSTSSRSTPPSSRPAALLLVGVAQVGVADLAERGELGARADRAGHEAGPARVGGHDLVGGAAGQLARPRPTARRPGRRCRTRRAARRSCRRCWSRPRRRPPRSSRGASGGRRRGAWRSAARCSPRRRDRRSRPRSAPGPAGTCRWRRRRSPPADGRAPGSPCRQGYWGVAAVRSTVSGSAMADRSSCQFDAGQASLPDASIGMRTRVTVSR